MNFYPHHIGDFDRATRHLTRIERSVYRDLLDVYYDTEKELTLDLPALCRKIIAKSNEEITAVEQTLNEFFTKTSTGWYHNRCEEEISKYHANNTQKSQAGKASAAAKALKKQQALNGNSTGVERTNNGTPTNQEPRTINQEPLTKDKYSGCPADAEPTAKTVTLKKMVEEGVDKQTASDWLTLRKAKRLPLTQTAWDSTKAEGVKVGMSAPETVAYAVKNNWAGFKASWCVKETAASAPSITVPPRQGIDPTLAGLIKESLSGAVKPPNDEIRRRMRELSGERA